MNIKLCWKETPNQMLSSLYGVIESILNETETTINMELWGLWMIVWYYESDYDFVLKENTKPNVLYALSL